MSSLRNLLYLGCAWSSMAAIGLSAMPLSHPTRAEVSVGKALPLLFEPDGQGGWTARGPGFSVGLGPATATFRLRTPAQEGMRHRTSYRSLVLRFVGADPHAALCAEDPAPTRVHRFQGHDPARWRAEVPTHRRVVARAVYPGIDVAWYGNDRQLEFDCLVAPGADPGCVAWVVEGSTAVRLTEAGDLAIGIEGRELIQRRPVAYQESHGRREPVAARFALDPAAGGRIRIELGDYDRSRPLVIDPLVSYASYYGGGLFDACRALALDPDGFLYVVGETASLDLPVANSLVFTNSGGTDYALDSYGNDAFVAKFTPDGRVLVFATYLGGAEVDAANAVAIDPSTGIWIAGLTMSADFPVTPDALSTNIAGIPDYGFYQPDAFLTCLALDGAAVRYSTYLGGSDEEEASAVAVGPGGWVYAGGKTKSTDFLQDPTQDKFGFPYRAFVVGLSGSDGYAVVLKVAGDDDRDPETATKRTLLNALGVGPDGTLWFGGETLETNLPTWNAYQPRARWSSQNTLGTGLGYFGHLNPDGSIGSLSYLGGQDRSAVFDLGFGADGSLYIAGSTEELETFLQSPDQLSSGLTAGLFDSSMRMPVGAGLTMELGAHGHATRLWGQSVGSTVYDLPWAAGAWYRSELVYDPGSSNLVLVVEDRASGDRLLTTSLKVASFASGVNRFGVSRRHMEGMLTGVGANAEVEYDLDNVRLYQGTGDMEALVYEETFAVDPRWTSTDTNRLAWSAATQTWNGSQMDYDGEYAYVTLPGSFDPNQPWRLRFEHVIHSEWADPDLATVIGSRGATNLPGLTARNVFVTKFGSNATDLAFATVVVGSSGDAPRAIAVDASGAATVAGITTSLDFPLVDPVQTRFGGVSDGILFRLDPTGQALDYSTYLGGAGSDELYGAALLPDGSVWLAGWTTSESWGQYAGLGGFSTNYSLGEADTLRRDQGDGLLLRLERVLSAVVEIDLEVGGPAVSWSADLPADFRLQSVRTMQWTNILMLNRGGSPQFESVYSTNVVTNVFLVSDYTGAPGSTVYVTNLVTNAVLQFSQWIVGGTSYWTTNLTAPPWLEAQDLRLTNVGGTQVVLTNMVTNTYTVDTVVTNISGTNTVVTTNTVTNTVVRSQPYPALVGGTNYYYTNLVLSAYSNYPVAPVLQGGRYVVRVTNGVGPEYFRLKRQP